MNSHNDWYYREVEESNLWDCSNFKYVEVFELKGRLYRARTRTRTTRKTMQFAARFSVLIKRGFPRDNRNLFCIKARSFANVNYCNARIINHEDGLSVMANTFHHIAEVVAYFGF